MEAKLSLWLLTIGRVALQELVGWAFVSASRARQGETEVLRRCVGGARAWTGQPRQSVHRTLRKVEGQALARGPVVLLQRNTACTSCACALHKNTVGGGGWESHSLGERSLI